AAHGPQRFVNNSAIRIGKRRTRMPVACQTALATAPALPVMPISPTPLMPSAFTCGSCSSTVITSSGGTSAFTGIWYSARLAFMILPDRRSVMASSCSAKDRPRIMPPKTWLRTRCGLTSPRAAKPPTMPGIGQVRRAGLEIDAVDIETDGVGGDLGERRPGALPHVMRADLHRAAAVAPDHRARLRLEHQCRERRRAHAPADQEAGIVAHLP